MKKLRIAITLLAFALGIALCKFALMNSAEYLMKSIILLAIGFGFLLFSIFYSMEAFGNE